MLRAEVFLVGAQAAGWRLFAANGRVLAVSGGQFRRASQCRADLEDLRASTLTSANLAVVRVASTETEPSMCWRWLLMDDTLTARARAHSTYGRQVQAHKSGQLFLELLRSLPVVFGTPS